MSAPPKVQRLVPSDTVFMLCDIQEKFRDLIDKMPHVIITAKAMLACAEKFAIPVIVTEQYPKFFQSTVPELDVSKAQVFAKTKFSMCTDEVMDCLTSSAESAGRRSVVLFGIETHVCVQQTALDLLEKGYNVHVVADGVSSQRAPDRAIALERLRHAGVAVTSAESVLFELLRTKDAAEFKDVSKIAKELAEAVGAIGESRL
mmetsp:Transcript_82458/g.238156  ORF Transcript_82458/g.238156 Transcript_82458/m.238156 type:complete len:203 (-) Transcript_82458:80-688(-)